MKSTVSSEDLKIGMYIELEGTWINHPFSRSKFVIKKERELEKIQEYCGQVVVDFSKSKHILKNPDITAERTSRCIATLPEAESPLVDEWAKKNTPADDLVQALKEDQPADQKSQAIFQHSVSLMDRLLSSEPTTELIAESVEPLRVLAECVINDDDVSKSLLSITSHDYYTYTHCVNVGMKSLLIAKHVLGKSDQELLKELSVGFFIHDIGKSQVDPAILNKPGKLTEQEFEIMRSHPERGVNILSQAKSLTESSRLITLQHHEKIDGSGYPYGLKGNQIHQFSQICALADIYDALTAERSYKQGMSVFDALSVMKAHMKNHFDEALFRKFIDLFVTTAKGS